MDEFHNIVLYNVDSVTLGMDKPYDVLDIF